MSEGRTGSSKLFGHGTIVYTTLSPLTCLAVNPKAQMLAVAGRNVFQVFSIHEDKFVSLYRVNTPSKLVVPKLQPAIGDSTFPEPPRSSTSTLSELGTGTPRTSLTVQSTSNRPRSYSVTDVAWSSVDDILATGSTGGDVILWDVQHNMTQTTCFSGHSRSIHCIMFNPTVATELVTASQDGKIKLFDTRDSNPTNSCRTFVQRATSPSPVRDVAYNPRHSVLFAAAQENGVVSIWDTRQGSKPYRVFHGHSCSISTLDWHSNWHGTGRNWLATAGSRDHLIQVWNLNDSNQTGCPPVIYTVRTTNVNRVRWRPGFVTQLVSSCNLTIDLSLHLWDLRRPFMPYATFEEHKDLVTSISWCPYETEYFYTVGRDGLLIRHCIKDGSRPAESSTPVALCLSPRGNLAHSVSQDHVLTKRPSVTIVDETNLVTQSPYYRAVKCSSDLNLTGDPNSHVQYYIPGFYASNTQNTNHNLPIMGSNESANLFIAQAHSLFFNFEPYLNATNLENTLVPDLIMSLAINYRFIGSSVDDICQHNATVALRFGQSYLVQFWSMLRSIYGSLPLSGELAMDNYRSLDGSKTKFQLEQTGLEPLSNHNNESESQKHRIVESIKPSAVKLSDILNELGIKSDITELPKTTRSSVLPQPSRRYSADEFIKLQTNQTTFNGLLLNSTEYNGNCNSNNLPHPLDFSAGSARSYANHHLDNYNLAVPPHPNSVDDPASYSSIMASTLIGSESMTSNKPHSDFDPMTHIQQFKQITSQEMGLGSVTSPSDQFFPHLNEPIDFLFHNLPSPMAKENVSNLLDLQSHGRRGSGSLSVLGAQDDPVVVAPPSLLSNECTSLGHTFLDSRMFLDEQPVEDPICPSSIDLLASGSFCLTKSNHANTCESLNCSDVQEEQQQQRAPKSHRIPSPQTSQLVNETQLFMPLNPEAVYSFTGNISESGQPSFNLNPVVPPEVTHLVVRWFTELVELGYVQTVCTALLALGAERLRIHDWVTDARLENWFTAYLELISRFRLWTISAQIIKQCGSIKGGADSSLFHSTIQHPDLMRPDLELRDKPTELNREQWKSVKDGFGMIHQSNCGTSSSLCLAPNIAALNQASTTLSLRCGSCNKALQTSDTIKRLTGHSGWACSRHNNTMDTIIITCALCHLTVRGLFVWCKGCNHGGHLNHIQAWLSLRPDCPAGCGHRCGMP